MSRSIFVSACIICRVLIFLFPTWVAADADAYARARDRLIEIIKADVVATRDHLQQDALDPRVIGALRKVPRHLFVPASQKEHAYENRPLPIGHGQTISQPYIVAIMTELLQPQPDHRVLEVGTGSGYQAAVLAELVESVYTIEIIEPLAQQGAENLHSAGYHKVHTRVGDGYYGWESAAPFDGILVTAVASHIPPPLIKQLKPGGRMVIPVGAPFMTQYLMLVVKEREGQISTRQILPVSFVPLTGAHAQR